MYCTLILFLSLLRSFIIILLRPSGQSFSFSNFSLFPIIQPLCKRTRMFGKKISAKIHLRKTAPFRNANHSSNFFLASFHFSFPENALFPPSGFYCSVVKLLMLSSEQVRPL